MMEKHKEEDNEEVRDEINAKQAKPVEAVAA